MPYDKLRRSFEDQLDLLKSRGMVVPEDQAALNCLERVDYHRLSASWDPFRRFGIIKTDDDKLSNRALEDSHEGTQFVDATF